MRKEYVGYIRVASKEDMSVEIQKDYIEEYAKQKNFKIDCYYIDDGFSETDFDRPQLNQMLREVKNIKKGIIVKDLSRISRDEIGLQKVLSKIVKQSIQLISTLEEENTKISLSSAFVDMKKNDELQCKMVSQKYFNDKV